jgi:hypothetical protein
MAAELFGMSIRGAVLKSCKPLAIAPAMLEQKDFSRWPANSRHLF